MPTIDIRGQSGASRGGARLSEIQKAAKALGLPEEVITGMRDIGTQAKSAQKWRAQRNDAILASQKEVTIRRRFARDQLGYKMQEFRAEINTAVKSAQINMSSVQKQVYVEASAEKKRQDDAKRAAFNTQYSEAKAINNEIESKKRAQAAREKEAAAAEDKLAKKEASEQRARDKAHEREVIRFDNAYYGAHKEEGSRQTKFDRAYYAAETQNTKIDVKAARAAAGAAGIAGGPTKKGKFGDPGFGRSPMSPNGGGAFGGPPGAFIGALEGGGLGAFIGKAGGIIGKIIGAGIALGTAAIEAPLLPGQLMRGAIDLARPAMNLKKSAYAIASAGGMSGADLYKAFSNYGAMSWMGPLGLTGESAMESVRGFYPGKGGRPEDIAMTLRTQQLSRGFYGMDEGTTKNVAQQYMGYTSMNTSPSGMNTYLNAIRATLTDAVEKGMDRAKVLDSIQTAIENLAQRGSSISTDDIRNMVARFSTAGTPGGQTGQSAVRMLSGLSDIAGDINANPSVMFAMNSEMSKYNYLKTPKDIMNFVGPTNFSKLIKTSPGIAARVINDATDLSRRGVSQLAGEEVSDAFLSGSPNRMGELLTDFYGGQYPKSMMYKILKGLGFKGQDVLGYLTGSDTAPPGINPDLKKLPQQTPQDVFQAEARGSLATLQGANDELNTLVLVTGKVVDGLEDFRSALLGATEALVNNNNRSRSTTDAPTSETEHLWVKGYSKYLPGHLYPAHLRKPIPFRDNQ